MNKRKIGIVVDSTTSDRFKEKFFKDASIVKLHINVNGESYVDGTLTNEQILEFTDKKLKATTSQPAPESFVQAFKEQLDLGYEKVICLTISGGLSGTINGANVAKEIIDNPNVIVIDSQTVGPGVEYLLEVINDMINKDKNFEEIIKVVNEKISEIYLYLSIEQLAALVAGGRLSKLQAAVGNILRVKPILKYAQGALTVAKKVRGVPAIYTYLANEVKAAAEKFKVYAKVAYVDSVEKAEQLINEIKKTVKDVIVQNFGPISPVVATHLGYSGLGVLIAEAIE
jgi:DegV family protein with EDD domain